MSIAITELTKPSIALGAAAIGTTVVVTHVPKAALPAPTVKKEPASAVVPATGIAAATATPTPAPTMTIPPTKAVRLGSHF
jgi:hypothetical protein